MATVKAGSFAQNGATGNQAVTGVGFRPKLLLFLGTNQSTHPVVIAGGRLGLGAAISSSQRLTASLMSEDGQATTDTRMAFKSDMAFALPNTTGDSVTDIFDLVSMDADGFTVDNKIAQSINIGYLAFDESVSAKVGTFDMNAATGNQAITGVGFQPKLLILLGALKDTVTEGAQAGISYCVGLASSASARAASAAYDQDNVGTSVAKNRVTASKCFLQIDASGVTTAADLVSFDGDGFTIDVTTAPASAQRVGYIAIGGLGFQAKVGTVASETDTNNHSYSGVGFEPNVMLFGGGYASSSGLDITAATFRVFFGMATGASASCWASAGADDAAGTSVAYREYDQGGFVVGRVIGLLADDATANFLSMDADGWSLDYTNGDSAARLFPYAAIRSVAPVGLGPAGNVFAIAS